MITRKIIEIDREKCNGCGLCTDACAEVALVLDEENKAVLAREIFCDGLGACLDVCPEDALKIIERESEEYDSQATYDHVLKTRGRDAAVHVHGAEPTRPNPAFSGCPGSMAREIDRQEEPAGAQDVSMPSELTQWPIQFHLVSPYSPYFKDSHLLIAADCTAFSQGGFHKDFLKGKKLIIACPKLDDTSPYIEKLSELFKQNNIQSLTVATMVVPCCSGLNRIVEMALDSAGMEMDVDNVVIGIDGEIARRQTERLGRHRAAS